VRARCSVSCLSPAVPPLAAPFPHTQCVRTARVTLLSLQCQLGPVARLSSPVPPSRTPLRRSAAAEPGSGVASGALAAPPDRPRGLAGCFTHPLQPNYASWGQLSASTSSLDLGGARGAGAAAAALASLLDVRLWGSTPEAHAHASGSEDARPGPAAGPPNGADALARGAREGDGEDVQLRPSSSLPRASPVAAAWPPSELHTGNAPPPDTAALDTAPPPPPAARAAREPEGVPNVPVYLRRSAASNTPPGSPTGLGTGRLSVSALTDVDPDGDYTYVSGPLVGQSPVGAYGGAALAARQRLGSVPGGVGGAAECSGHSSMRQHSNPAFGMSLHSPTPSGGLSEIWLADEAGGAGSGDISESPLGAASTLAPSPPRSRARAHAPAPPSEDGGPRSGPASRDAADAAATSARGAHGGEDAHARGAVPTPQTFPLAPPNSGSALHAFASGHLGPSLATAAAAPSLAIAGAAPQPVLLRPPAAAAANGDPHGATHGHGPSAFTAAPALGSPSHGQLAGPGAAAGGLAFARGNAGGVAGPQLSRVSYTSTDDMPPTLSYMLDPAALSDIRDAVREAKGAEANGASTAAAADAAAGATASGSGGGLAAPSSPHAAPGLEAAVFGPLFGAQRSQPEGPQAPQPAGLAVDAPPPAAAGSAARPPPTFATPARANAGERLYLP
jgi:hypothetical protein